jgi:hypothetical protein
MIGIVQYWLLVIARPQVRILPSEAHLIVNRRRELGLCAIIVSRRVENDAGG